MRTFSLFSLCVLIAVGAFIARNNLPEIKQYFHKIVPGNKIHILERRFSADSLMKAHKKNLLKDSRYAFLQPKLTYHPYLLLEIKYSRSQERTGEGFILWSLLDGEMVINAKTWEKTHGFADCITSKATSHPNELEIIYELRQALSDLTPVDAMNLLLSRLKKTNSNAEFLLSMKK